MNEIPKYTSIFKEELKELVQLKRAEGCKYETESKAFKRLDQFFVAHELSEKNITKELADEWCRKRSYESTTNQNNRISLLNIFLKYISSIGINTYVLPKNSMVKKKKYDAHIYTDDELQRLFRAIDASISVPKEAPYRAVTLPVFWMMLYATGMRVSELRLIKLKDIDFEQGILKITTSKNYKERLIPIHPKLTVKCIELKKTIHATSNEEEYFFMLKPGIPMSLGNLDKNFRRYLEKAGISHGGRGKGPRIHDLRHTYAVNLLRKWTDEGKDLLAYTPYMRVILGHETFEETAYYLKLTSERFPYIKDQLKTSFQCIVEEVTDYEEPEFE